MLLESIILAILIGLLVGGKLSSLFDVNPKRLELLFLGALFQLFAFWSVKLHLGWENHWTIPFSHSLSYLLLIGFTLKNRSYGGFSLVSLGIAFNGVVIVLNSGLMPVDPAYLPEASRQLLQAGTGTHGILTDSTRLNILADILFINIPVLGKQLFSLGDILIDLGMGIFIIMQMRRSENRPQ
ncbi:DUF5317 domain-containing protein [Desulfitobacterium chlororespirans]|uniref:DUF5317 domain-containing protein n=1 Tax=Desulfitobacterium chlororespirans DSM 11544 TaxID=1121395 RepID=A0A1M7S1R7_9FIRM|nr:DUF5317 domain-containing protein [Desulfitobacterium chlororespirans]SHN52463.1 hypothetical protein SAMN02745215_00406 [Desulfitobacterium chlororespirans DSM 11544]